MLLREMSHRVKNLFTLAGAVVALSRRSAGSVEQLAEAIQSRLGALARAHELTLPDVKRQKAATPASLQALLRTIVSPYEDQAGQTVSVSGADIAVEGHAVTSLALVFHELATNAAKYGALSVAGGRIDAVLSVAAGQLHLDWLERGGPPIIAPPDTVGFGTWLVDGTIQGQLHGSVERRWHPEGLGIRIAIPLSQLSAGSS